MNRHAATALVCLAIAAPFLLSSGASLAADGFTYYDFKCPDIGIERHKDSLTTTVKRSGETLVVKYVCDVRSCFNLQRLSNGGLQFRHIYFPRGRTEFIYSTAIWFADEETPKVTDSRVVPLVTCKPN